MATYEKGANGIFSGKVGSVVGSSWKGIHYIKGLSNNIENYVPSEAQQGQRNKINVAGNFMKSLKLLVKLGFDNDVPNRAPYNTAIAYVMKNALDSTTNPYSIRYSKVLITRGEYPGADNIAATPGTSGQILFSWTDTTGLGQAKANDKVVVAAYSPILNQFIFNSNAAIRSAGTVTLSADAFKGQTVETYIAFMKTDGSDISSGVHSGQVTVAA
jgi:hypothetical protein